MEEIAVKMRHAALEQICTLIGGFSGADGGRCATIPGNHQPAKVGHRDWTTGNPVRYVAVIKLPRDAPGRETRASILYLWIFEGEYKEEVVF